MNFFGSKQFHHFLKNKKSFNIINRDKINRIKAYCLNKLETRAIVSIKNSTSTNALIQSTLINPLALSQIFLMKLSKTNISTIEGK
jgi:hypothetical protein